MASPPPTLVPRSSSLGDSSSQNGTNIHHPHYTTKERSRANTVDSNNTGILSPACSKDDEYDFNSIADDDDDVVSHDDDDDEDNLMDSGGMLILDAPSHSPTRNNNHHNNNNNNHTTPHQYDLCGTMYKRRGGFGRNKENNWKLRSFTLYGHILCYFESSSPEQIIDPSKPRARLNLAKTETIAEMHSKHKLGLPTDHLLTINIYDPVIRSKRKWEMCCLSREEQVRWYNAIRVHDGVPVTTTTTMMGGGHHYHGIVGGLGRLGGGLKAWSPGHEHEEEGADGHHRHHDDLFGTKKMVDRLGSHSSTDEDNVLVAKAAEKAFEVWMEKDIANKKELSRGMMILLFVTMNVTLYIVRNASDETFQATLFFINVFVLYTVMGRAGRPSSSSFNEKRSGGKMMRGSLKAKVAEKKSKLLSEAAAENGVNTTTTTSSAPNNEQSHHVVKLLPGSTMPRSSPVKNTELETTVQNFGVNSTQAIRAYAVAPSEWVQVQPHSYTQTDAPLFNLRIGPNYKRNKQKAPSAPALYDLYSTDFLYDSAALKNVSDKFQIPTVPGITDVSTGHAHIPPMLVINTWLPGEEPNIFAKNNTDGDTYSIPMVFVLSQDTLEQLKDIETASPGVKLWSEWCRRAETEPEFRGRFKCMGQIEDIESSGIPKFIQGYNGKPALVTKSGTFTRHENYIEFTINVNHWAFLAKKGLHALIPFFQEFIFHIGFTIEARCDEEMPEVLLGGCRFMNLDPEKAYVDE